MLRAILAMAVLLAASPLAQAAPDGPAAKLKEKNVYVFDNNHVDVFKAGHLPHAKWLNPSEYDAKELPTNKNATLIFYCQHEY